MIPRIIHQTWKSTTLPPCYLPSWPQSWREHNPSYEYILHTDVDNWRLAEEMSGCLEMPELPLIFQDRGTPGVVKSDFARLLYLWKFGGIYADLDYACLKPLDSLLGDHRVVVSRMDLACPNYIHNAFIAAEAKCELICSVLEESLLRWRQVRGRPFKPVHVAGPETISQILQDFSEAGLFVAPPRLTCPLSWKRGETAKGKPSCIRPLSELASKWPDAYAVTFWTHNW